MTAVYAAGDPRAQLSAQTPSNTRAVGDAVLPFQHYELTTLEPQMTTARGSKSWVFRAQNVVAVWTELTAGDSIERTDHDETMLLVLLADERLSVQSACEHANVEATSIAMIPPGPSTITANGAATILSLHTTRATDLLNRAHNRSLYEPIPESVAVHTPWPQPTGGYRLRVYADLDAVEPSPDRMGRIYRNQHAMVNFLYPRVGPRDPRTLSPHDHDDFEQISVAYGGSYVHHIRAHWGSDRLQWRDDQHVESTGPSFAIIPPPLLHTSEAVGPNTNRMIDVFAGPRVDFSDRAGWVLNAADYPTPKRGDANVSS